MSRSLSCFFQQAAPVFTDNQAEAGKSRNLEPGPGTWSWGLELWPGTWSLKAGDMGLGTMEPETVAL